MLERIIAAAHTIQRNGLDGDVGSSEVEFIAFVQQPVNHNCNRPGKSKDYKHNIGDDCADRQFAALVVRTEFISLVMWFCDTANKVFKQWILAAS